MNAAVIRKFGEPPRCEQFPEPVADDNEVIVQVRAASLKPVDKQLASGSHYASSHELPFICGTDGVGQLHDGRRVFFGGCRPPHWWTFSSPGETAPASPLDRVVP